MRAHPCGPDRSLTNARNATTPTQGRRRKNAIADTDDPAHVHRKRRRGGRGGDVRNRRTIRLPVHPAAQEPDDQRVRAHQASEGRIRTVARCRTDCSGLTHKRTTNT